MIFHELNKVILSFGVNIITGQARIGITNWVSRAWP